MKKNPLRLIKQDMQAYRLFAIPSIYIGLLLFWAGPIKSQSEADIPLILEKRDRQVVHHFYVSGSVGLSFNLFNSFETRFPESLEQIDYTANANKTNYFLRLGWEASFTELDHLFVSSFFEYRRNHFAQQFYGNKAGIPVRAERETTVNAFSFPLIVGYEITLKESKGGVLSSLLLYGGVRSTLLRELLSNEVRLFLNDPSDPPFSGPFSDQELLLTGDYILSFSRLDYMQFTLLLGGSYRYYLPKGSIISYLEAGINIPFVGYVGRIMDRPEVNNQELWDSDFYYISDSKRLQHVDMLVLKLGFNLQREQEENILDLF